MMGEVLISLIVPTRGRPDGMRSFLESVRDHASFPQNIEVIMVVDQDDPASQEIVFDGLKLITVVVPPGSTMGSLNMAGYRVCSGKYIMLMNDDVRVRTSAWDDKTLAIFHSFPDDIVLVHVNDMIFKDNLCTFPFVSRKFCEFTGGICLEDYKRYRIDDHIYHIFNLLALLGHLRIVYLPDVVFEHHNSETDEHGEAQYVPNPAIHATDSVIFNELVDSRKEIAIRLAEWIETQRRKAISDTRRKFLAPYNISEALRGPERIRIMPEGKPARNSRVTIGVVSASLYNEHARTCVDLLKKHTQNFDLVVLDNNYGAGFNHSREMNRLLDVCRTDFLVLMDDDVWVTPGWLESLLSCVAPDVGVVTPLHLDRNGKLAYAGIVLRPDGSGHHSHIYRAPEAARPTQTLCSAVMLIDMTKVGHLRLDESYSKYFLDIDYGLQVWEAGFKVLVDPNSICTHLAGATLEQGSALSSELFETQRHHWVKEWISTGRLTRLLESVWKQVPELREVIDFPTALVGLIVRNPGESVDAFIDRAFPVLKITQGIPALQQYMRTKVAFARECIEDSLDEARATHLTLLTSLIGEGSPFKVASNWKGYDIYVLSLRFFAVLAGSPIPGPEELLSGSIPGSLSSSTLQAIHEVLDRDRTEHQRQAEKKLVEAFYMEKFTRGHRASFWWWRRLRFVSPHVEREIGKTFCTFGLRKVGTMIWDNAGQREALRQALQGPEQS